MLHENYAFPPYCMVFRCCFFLCSIFPPIAFYVVVYGNGCVQSTCSALKKITSVWKLSEASNSIYIHFSACQVMLSTIMVECLAIKSSFFKCFAYWRSSSLNVQHLEYLQSFYHNIWSIFIVINIFSLGNWLILRNILFAINFGDSVASDLMR